MSHYQLRKSFRESFLLMSLTPGMAVAFFVVGLLVDSWTVAAPLFGAAALASFSFLALWGEAEDVYVTSILYAEAIGEEAAMAEGMARVDFSDAQLRARRNER